MNENNFKNSLKIVCTEIEIVTIFATAFIEKYASKSVTKKESKVLKNKFGLY